MEGNQKNWTCTECGYTSSVRFPEDICPKCSMTYWKCPECVFTIVAKAPPGICPECGKKCEFINLTCYIPDWGNSEISYSIL